MPRKRAPAGPPVLGVYASTGRTGSTFLCDLFRRSPVAGVVHSRLGERLDRTAASPAGAAAAYLGTMRAMFPAASVYVEGNPRFVERFALGHALADPTDVLNAVRSRGAIVRGLLMFRHPEGFAVSMKGRLRERDRRLRELGRDAEPVDRIGPGGPNVAPYAFERVYGEPAARMDGLDRLGRICASWTLRNRFLSRLADADGWLVVRFEDLFGPDVDDRSFVRQIQEIHEHFRLPAYTRLDELLAARRRPRNAAENADGLSAAEREQLRALCGSEAARLGYAL